MKENQSAGKIGIISQKNSILIRKELFRKLIHLATAFVPFFLSIARVPVLVCLLCVLILYCIAEFMRYKGKRVFVVSSVTEIAARKRDSNKFVLGPVTLATGVLLTAVLFDHDSASIGIYALAFGDGLASLVGKVFGKHEVSSVTGKTVEGSSTCFLAIFCATFFVTKDIFISLIIAIMGTIIEILPLKDFDNFFIPLILSAIAQFYFHI